MTAIRPDEFSGVPDQSERARAESQVQQMEFHRESMVPHWRELASYFSPRSPRIDLTKENRGAILNRHILDEAAIYARRTLASGLHWGITNPSRAWKQLTVSDPEQAEDQSIKDWLHLVNERMDTVLARSNFYDVMASTYDDVIVYANAAYAVEEDEEDIIRCVPFGVGSYAIADDARGNVTAFSRQFYLTVRQLIERFGTVNGKPTDAHFSQAVKDLIAHKKWEDKVQVTHLICPNEDYDGVRDTPDAKRWASYYWETGVRPITEAQHFLRKDGYSEWPVMMFRWRRVPDDPWAQDCPAMSILGTNKSLQQVERKALKLLDKAVDPALTGPAELEKKRVSLLPGDFTATTDRNVQLRAIHDVRLDALQAVLLKQQDMRERIHDAFFTRLMLFISNAVSPRSDRTAREVEEISQEKYLVLGTVLESFNTPFGHLIDRVFAIMLRRGLIPPAPESLQGTALKVEYTSIMAQAQKAVGLGNIERFLLTVANIAKLTGQPRALVKVDMDQAIDELGIRSGIPPRVVRSDEDVAEIERAEAEARAEERQVALAAQEAKAAKDLSQSPMGGDTALTQLVGAAGGAR